MREFELAHQLMDVIKQTDEWERIWMEYPGVVEAKAQLDAVMKRVSARIPSEMVDELFDAMGKLDWANECASVLYGIRLASSVSAMIKNPSEFSRHTYNE